MGLTASTLHFARVEFFPTAQPWLGSGSTLSPEDQFVACGLQARGR